MKERELPQLSFPPPRATSRDGLCATCRFVRMIETAKGSRFLLCERSKDDPRFPRYPAQPRMECAGFQR